VIQGYSPVSFCCLLEWLYTGRCDFNPREGLNASRGAAKLFSESDILEVIRLADQYCLPDLVATSEVQLSERIIKYSTTNTSQLPKQDPQLKQFLDELVG